ncbi:hypothetical protein SAMN05216486_11226 [bacterium JGI 053]|nr:hypothetical protein SAMN05216486_11226 [bacterium JGI 053]
MKFDRTELRFLMWFKAVFGLILFLIGLNSSGTDGSQAISIFFGLVSVALAFKDAFKLYAPPPASSLPKDETPRNPLDY